MTGKVGETKSVYTENRKKQLDECNKRGSRDKENPTCRKCRGGMKLVIADVQGSPERCPMLDSLRLLNPILALGAFYQTQVMRSLSTFQRISEQVARQQKVFQENVQRLLVRSAIPILNVSQSFTESITTLMEATKFLHEEEFQRFEYNWVSFLPIGDVKALYEQWKTGDEDKVRDFFIRGLKKAETLKNLIVEFGKDPWFTPRMDILKEAFFAHQQGLYALSIPVLWSQVDGIFLNAYGKVLSGRTEICQTCKRPMFLPNAKNIARELLPADTEFVPEYLNYIIRSYSQERQGILHGLDVRYPSADKSTKLILALIVLYEALSARARTESGKNDRKAK